MLLVQFKHSISTLSNTGRQRGPCASFNLLFYSWSFSFVSYFISVSRVFWTVAGATAVVLLLRQGCRSGILSDAIQIQMDQCPSLQTISSRAENIEVAWPGGNHPFPFVPSLWPGAGATMQSLRAHGESCRWLLMLGKWERSSKISGLVKRSCFLGTEEVVSVFQAGG